VIGAGTGLGQAYVLPQADGRARVLTSEGGHVSFAPRDALERSLLAWLGARHGRVSAERVVSGLGLVNLYTFLVEEAGVASSDGVRRAVSERGAVAIAEHAEPTGDGGPDVACVQALDRFVSLFGAQAGDAALSLVPAGGVFVAGGIAPRQLARMKAGFLPAFLDKGRMRPLLERLAVSVVLAGDAGLRGAGVIAGEFG
jgi:glucokinase